MPSQSFSAPNTGGKKNFTLEAYFDLEMRSDVRHEYLDGEIRAMSYTSPEHGEIQMNIAGNIYQCLKKKGCKLYTSDRMVYVQACNKVFYPDILVVCGEQQFHSHKGEMKATLNPILILEILSKSTEEEDKIDKWACYQKIKSLRQYILVSQREKLIQSYHRTGDERQWVYTATEDNEDIVDIQGCTLLLKQVYSGIGQHDGPL
ncbi:MAG: Uma2 family endonuclease [Lewinellaceae bacterium]|nr:Uma2 family endonuclease [Lewinellaceae bacterium]